ncbi:MAG: lipid A deacylase LpxR family protein [Opitutaceae bacterium]
MRIVLFAAFSMIAGLLLLAAAAPTPPAEPSSSTGIDLEPLTSLRIGSVSLYSENDKYFAGTDRNYSSGFKLSFLSTDVRGFDNAELPFPVSWAKEVADRVLDEEAEAKVGFAIGHSMYTPTDVRATEYIPDDRPYAAWLYLGAAFHNYRPAGKSGSGAQLEVFEINLGVVGPSAFGQQIQNAIHDLIDVERSEGWDNQIHDEPGLNLIYEKKWRFSSEHARTTWGLDLMPHVGVSLGNVFTYANTGVEIRAGYALPADFGTSLIRPSGDSNSSRPRFTFFLFLSADGRAVARDITLDGNSFRDSPSIDKKTFVYDIMGGFGVGNRRAQLTYTQARRSPEFEGQDDPQDFGSVAVSIFF